MSFPLAPAGAPLGLQPDKEEVRVMNRTGGAVVVGQAVQFDLAQSDGDVSNSTVGDTASSLANVISVAGTDPEKIFAVVTEAGADNAEIKVCLRGSVDVSVAGSVQGTGSALTVVATQAAFDTDAVTGSKIVGMLLEAKPSTGTDTGVRVLFDGVHGFGIQ